MFLHLCVILFTGGVASQHALQVTQLGGGGSVSRGSTSRGVCIQGDWTDPPPPLNIPLYGQQAGGLHPTGMHTYLF